MRDKCCELDCDKPFPLFAYRAFLEAFKACNEDAWIYLDRAFQQGPMAKFSDEELGKNGKDLLKTASRDWFGNIACLQLTTLHKHKEHWHFDGGAAIMILVVTAYGSRRLTLECDGRRRQMLRSAANTTM